MDTMWEFYLRPFQTGRVSEQKLASAMTEAVFISDGEVLYRLITSVRSGRRVFKQLCLKGGIPSSVFAKLEARGETDLAFHVACCHSMWPFVLQLYDNPQVRAQSREQAFHKALRHGVWEIVTQMVASDAGSPTQRRTAFCEAVRQEQLQVAYQLYNDGDGLNNGDLVFALQACLRLRMWEVAVDFIKKISSVSVYNYSQRKLLSAVVKGSFADGKHLCFLNLATHNCRVVKNRMFLRILLREATRKEKMKFILAFCRQCVRLGESFCSRRALRIATIMSVQKSKWQLLKKLSRLNKFSMSELQLIRTIDKSFKDKITRKLCAPIVDGILERRSKDFDMFYLFEYSSFSGYLTDNARMASNAKWCLNKAYYQVAFLLSVRSLSWNTLRDVVRLSGSRMSEELLCYALSAAVDNDNLETACEILKYLPDQTNILSSDIFYDEEMCESLFKKCKENGMTKWAVKIVIGSGDWDVVKDEMRMCHDRSILDFTIVQAAENQRWELVESLMHRCSQTTSALTKPLIQAVFRGQVQLAKRLIRKIDPRLQDSLLELATRSYPDREDMVKVCIEAGLSTHEAVPSQPNRPSSRPSAMLRALQNGQLPLVKLLHISGAATNDELYRLSNDQLVTNQLNRQGRRDIIQYLQGAACTPRSLKDLCRLCISHLIGCQPGRKVRIESLPVPRLAKDFIRFRDILKPK